jgi:CRP-like cAMP-binding protein
MINISSYQTKHPVLKPFKDLVAKGIKLAWFLGLCDYDYQDIRGVTQIEKFKEGDIIYKAGEKTADRIYLLLSGVAHIEPLD